MFIKTYECFGTSLGRCRCLSWRSLVMTAATSCCFLELEEKWPQSQFLISHNLEISPLDYFLNLYHSLPINTWKVLQKCSWVTTHCWRANMLLQTTPFLDAVIPWASSMMWPHLLTDFSEHFILWASVGWLHSPRETSVITLVRRTPLKKVVAVISGLWSLSDVTLCSQRGAPGTPLALSPSLSPLMETVRCRDFTLTPIN